MAVITIGPGAVNLPSSHITNCTIVDKNAAADGTGAITSFELWFATTGGSVKVGTFSGSGTNYTNRNVEIIGTVTAGSKQTFSGLDCEVETGDWPGVYMASGTIEYSAGYAGTYWKAGDQFPEGEQAYTLSAGGMMAIYGTGVTAGATIEPSAIASAEAFGTPKLNLKLEPSAIASGEAFGTPKLILKLLPSGIASAEAFGTLSIGQVGYIQPTGIASAEAFGTAAVIIDQFLSPSGIASAEALGAAQLNLWLALSAIASGEAFGTPKLTLYLLPSAISSAEAIGSATVIPGAVVIIPSAIASEEAFGTLNLSFAIFIIPAGISSGEAIPSPRLIRELIHIILDGQYITHSPGVNRAYVIGQDSEGNPVHGTDLEQDEIDLLGERLDFQQQLSIPTSALAEDVADAILKKRRLTKHAGFILIPPNAGAELWDVIQVTDSPCAQAAKKYRIAGIAFEYQPRKSTYEHRIILAAP